MDLIQTKIFCEEKKETLIINLTRNEYDRARVGELLLDATETTEDSTEATQDATETIQSTAATPSHEDLSTQDATETTQSTTATPSHEGHSLFMWNTPCVLLLLSIYEEQAEDFKNCSKRHIRIWEEIAKKMGEINTKYKVTGLQCQTKLNGLKRTYKKILDHNGKSGNDRATWPFFDRMDEIFGRTGWAQPRALASSDPADQSAGKSQEKEATKPNKKDAIEKYLLQKKEDRRQRMQEKENRHNENEAKKDYRFKKLLEMRERQHKEKMKLLELFLEKRK